VASRELGFAGFCIVVMLIFGNTMAAAIVSESQARQIARTAVAPDSSTFLSVHRRQDLEDKLCGFIMLGNGAPQNSSCAFVFEVSEEGYEFKQGKVDIHRSVHGPFIHYVVVSGDSGEAFRIAGFKDSRDEFNRMAKALYLRVWDDSGALQYAELYREVDPTNLRLELPKSDLESKQLAEKNSMKAFISTLRPRKATSISGGRMRGRVCSTRLSARSLRKLLPATW
jgi:hypothetical protein